MSSAISSKQDKPVSSIFENGACISKDNIRLKPSEPSKSFTGIFNFDMYAPPTNSLVRRNSIMTMQKKDISTS